MRTTTKATSKSFPGGSSEHCHRPEKSRGSKHANTNFSNTTRLLVLVVLISSVLCPTAHAGTLPTSSSSQLDSTITVTAESEPNNTLPNTLDPDTFDATITEPIFNKNAKSGRTLRTNHDSIAGKKLAFLTGTSRGGGARARLKGIKVGTAQPAEKQVPSFYWAVLHNWLYFLSLGFNAVNIPYLIREVVDGPNHNGTPSPRSIALSGNVEAVDKILTFGGIAFLSALSDKYGRKPLIVWSSLGFALTNLLQALSGSVSPSVTTSILYLADFVDGCSSCMGPVCQAYVADCSPPSGLASNLGIFQGLSIGGAFILAFPIGGFIGNKHGPKLAIRMAAGFQLLNCLIALILTPESNSKAGGNADKKIRLSEVNPITGLQKLFGLGGNNSGPSVSLLRTASLAYFSLSLARCALDAQFINYTNLRFGWTQAQSGPVLVMVGLMLAIVPRIVVPRIGLQRSINYGLIVYALGFCAAGLVSQPAHFVGAIAVIAFGCVAIPALQALLANLAPPGESGALLGAVGSLTELTGAIGSSMYATLVATFAVPSSTSGVDPEGVLEPPSFFWSGVLPNVDSIPGMHFLVGACFCLIGWAISTPGLNQNRDHPALKTAVDKELLSGSAS
ncbi:unnamed protein product [Pseudo-nitzschia multistriata]|uniref:Major facilitator superfamily (MFS) profile domain-containing protein n=1 Tax=Pseudo-nitzschia multistriata TaxID=183589 RepID=A0A448ZE56_9STRA|nr:unnamed protein product [Pseudo-nitzschia multistriata]